MSSSENTAQFPSLTGWEPTRDTLHGYVQAISAVPRAMAEPHPKWWHIGLSVQQHGAATGAIPYPGDPAATFHLLLNLTTHSAEAQTSHGDSRSLSMTDGLSALEFADGLAERLMELGVQAELNREKIERNAADQYDPNRAEAYRNAVVRVNQVLDQQRQRLEGETGPILLWPHNFDLAFTWFGSREVSYEEQGETKRVPSQIGFGFAPGDASHPEPYFYANPWPFDDELAEKPLPSGARWFTDSWKGTLLPYASVVGQSADRLHDYFQAVHDLASPLLIK